MKENKFREYKKLIIGTTHEIMEYESIAKECLDYISSL